MFLHQMASSIPPAAMAAPKNGAFVIKAPPASPLLVEELSPPADEADPDEDAAADVEMPPPASLLA